MLHRIRHAAASFSPIGLVLGTLAFAASLTPSLIPRDTLMQGALGGLSLSIGYGVGVGLQALWRYLELPRLNSRLFTMVSLAAIAACVSLAGYFLLRASEWQDSIRSLMGMEPVDNLRPLEVAAITLIVFAVVVVVARLLALFFGMVAGTLRRFIPRPVANVVGAAVTVMLFWSLVDGLLLRYALRVVDGSFRQVDELVDSNVPAPSDPSKTGSSASLIAWEGIGAQGRDYVASGPSQAEIGSFTGTAAKEPLRVYVGLNSSDTAEKRARLALDELIRVGGFERSALVVITPTGTGWVDPAGIDPVEFLHGGDIASVAIQYSYLPSWLSLLVEPGYGSEASRALFSQVYGYWKSLPKDHRPKLYLYGLSLGAMNSDLSTDMFDVVADPFQGAVWSGPPFPSRTWRMATAERNPGSPAWLPRFRDGSIIRFTGQRDALDLPGAAWGPIRIVYLQYASDPITFFNPYSIFREPDWMKGERGPDVSPQFRWFPIVTLLQLTVDIAAGTTTPMGHGHVYAPEHYIDAWVAVTAPQGWTARDIERLKAYFVGKRQSA